MVTTTNSTIPGFVKLLRQAEQDGIVLDNSKQSLEWLRKKYATIRPSDVVEKRFLSETDRRRNVALVGRMYMFLYKPKYKDELPYYDRFPLVFPFRRVAGGFYGLNLHYLAPKYRAILMDQLYGLLNNTEFDDTTRLKMTYKVLDSSSKYRWFRPCVKHYLKSHMQSTLIYIEPTEWNLALFVPSEQFRKDNKRNVWQDSYRSVI
ncbi:hypothetical protein OAU13_01010 [bacterium]|nr:hypothetical protein [bacterium]